MPVAWPCVPLLWGITSIGSLDPDARGPERAPALAGDGAVASSAPQTADAAEPAVADEAPHAQDEHAGDEAIVRQLGERMPHEWPNLVGLKLIGAMFSTTGGKAGQMVGFGALLEHVLIERWLEVELSANFFVGPFGPVIPIDVFLKKPFHLGRIVDPFVGLGPVFALIWARDPFVIPGIGITGGSNFWFRERLGVVVEADYVLGIERHALVQEFEVSFGPLYRF